jgi:hypothetical protein
MLRQRTLLGEFQPGMREGEKSVKAGEAIEGYYPALLTLDEFYKVQAALDSRRKQKGRRGKLVTSLFTGLLIDTQDGEQMVVRRPRAKNVLVSNGYFKGKSKWRQLDYSIVETTLLTRFLALTPADLYPVQAGKEAAELADVEGKIADLQAKMDAWGEEALSRSAALSKLIATAEAKQLLLISRREEFRGKMATANDNTLGETQDLVTHLAGLEGDALLDARTRLKALIRQMVEMIGVIVHGPKEAAFVVSLNGGNEILIGDTGELKRLRRA